MKHMTAREYLNQARRAEARLRALRERMERYQVLAVQATAAYGNGRGGGSQKSSRVEKYACRMADLAAELRERSEACAALIAEIEGVIDRVPDERYRDVLRYRYLNGWSHERIAREMHYTLHYVQQMHVRALGMVEADGVKR